MKDCRRCLLRVRWVATVCAAAALLASHPALAVGFEFDSAAVTRIFARCKQATPAFTQQECRRYLQGLAEGWCVGQSKTKDEIKPCMISKQEEIKQTLKEMATDKGIFLDSP